MAIDFKPILTTLATVSTNTASFDLTQKRRSNCVIAPYEGGAGTEVIDVTLADYKDKLKSGIAFDIIHKLFKVEADLKPKLDKIKVLSPTRNQAATMETPVWNTQTGDATVATSGTPIGDYVYRFYFTVGGQGGVAQYKLYKRNTGSNDEESLGAFTTPVSLTPIVVPDGVGLSLTFTDGANSFLEADELEVTVHGPSSTLTDYLDILDAKVFHKSAKYFRYVQIVNKAGFDFSFATSVDSLAKSLDAKLMSRCIFAVPYLKRVTTDDFHAVYYPAFKNALEQYVKNQTSKRVVVSPMWSEDGFPLVSEGIAKKAIVSLAESPAESKYAETKFLSKWISTTTPNANRLMDGEYWADIEDELAYEVGALPYAMIASEQFGSLKLHSVPLAAKAPSTDDPDQRRWLQDAVILDEVLDWISWVYYRDYFDVPTASEYGEIKAMHSGIAGTVLTLDAFRGQVRGIRMAPVDEEGVSPDDPALDQLDKEAVVRKIEKDHAESGTHRALVVVTGLSYNQQLKILVEFRKIA